MQTTKLTNILLSNASHEGRPLRNTSASFPLTNWSQCGHR